MGTTNETVSIRFVESGARVIKRKIDDIGESANRATHGMYLLKRALFVLSAGGAITALARYADALTNMENRLRLTSTSASNLEAVQDSLFASANRSRSAVEATGEIYTRVALSARNLGASQQDVISVTETLQKAAVISGASAREANAALIQLGQGLASDRLSGDELRSVLEQLPYVADIIVDYLNKTGQFGNVTRGTLRQLGKEGKLTAKVVFDAIKNSQESVDALFAQTNPTIEQALNVARNNLLKFIDDFDDATGASTKFANAIIILSQNIGTIVAALGVLAGAAAGAFTFNTIASVVAYGKSLENTGKAITRYHSIQVAARAATYATADATAAETAAKLANIQQRRVAIGVTLKEAQAEYAAATAAFSHGRARDAQTGRFVASAGARDRLQAASIRLAAAERAEAISAGRLATLRTELAVAENAQAAASARLTAAQVAQSGMMARFAGSFPMLAGAVRLVTGAFSGLTAVIASNPYGAAAVAIGLVIAALWAWGDNIKVTSDGLVSLKGVAVATFQVIYDAIAPLAGPIWEGIKTGVGFVVSALWELAKAAVKVALNFAEYFIDALTAIPRFAIAVVMGVISAFKAMPGQAAEVAMGIANVLIAGFEAFANGAIQAINKVIGAINKLVAFVGGKKAAEWFGFSGQLPEIPAAEFARFKTEAGDIGKSAGDAFIEGFSSSYESGKISNVLDKLTDPIMRRARINALDAKKDKGDADGLGGLGGGATVTPTDGGGGSKGKSGSTEKTFAQEMAELQQKIDLEKQYGLQKEVTNNIMSIEKSIKRQLTDTEKEQVATATALLEISKMQGQVLQDILGPQEQMRLGQTALNQLFEQGAITLEQYNSKLRELQINSDKASNTIAGGFRAAIAGSIQSAGEFGEALGNVVVGAAGKAADAIVEFAQTGRMNIKQFFADLFAQLLKLAAQRLLLTMLGGLLGVPGGGFSSAGAGGMGILGMASGGSILPTGPGSTDSQLVAFAKRPDERVDILTPGQQQAQKDGQGGGTTVVQSPPVNVAALLSPDDIIGVFNNGGDTQIINILQRNASTVRQIAGS